MRMKWLRPALVVAAISAGCLAVEDARQIHLQPIQEGVRQRIGGVPARAAEMSETPPASLRVKPRDELKSPLYGVMPVGFEGIGRVFHVIVDTGGAGPNYS